MLPEITTPGTDAWQADGFVVHRGMLNADDLGYLASVEVSAGSLEAANAAKQLWTVDTRVRDIARNGAIVARLQALFAEEGFYLWGAQLIDKDPGDVHPWHSDLETVLVDDGFVSLWLPVAGETPTNTLRAIAGSHRYGVALQSLFAWGDPVRGDPRGEAILARASAYDSGATLVSPSCGAGDGLFFHGSLWHGSFNGDGGARRALLLQYGSHRAPVRLVKDRTVYPARYHDESPPRVLPLRGAPNPLLNHNVRAEGHGLVYPRASIARSPALDNATQQAWKRFPYFETETPVSAVVICHASALLPGCMPHLPHRHDREEVLVILDGEATILSEDPDDGVLRSIGAAAGDLFYYPSGHAHTILNAGERPIRYLMFRWQTHAPADGKASSYRYRRQDYAVGSERFVVERPSSGLAHLHIHFTRLQPGEAFPSHIDCYDTGILVLEGRLSMLEHDLGPGGVFYVRAGELHNTRNETDEVCEYLVFEFHARPDHG